MLGIDLTKNQMATKLKYKEDKYHNKMRKFTE